MLNTIVEVHGDSLKGILSSGDKVKITEASNIKRDDLIVFRETPEQVSIKVCKGVPGDKITINSETNCIYVNGTLAPVNFTNPAQIHCWKDWLKFTNGNVPSGHVFLLGTTDESIDSRSRGFFSFEQIIGVAEKVI